MKSLTRARQKRMIQSDDAPCQIAWTHEEEIALAKDNTHEICKSSRERKSFRERKKYDKKVEDYLKEKCNQHPPNMLGGWVGKTVTCDTCKKPGHNKRSCKNGAGGSQASKMSAATPIASQASAARGPQRFAPSPISSQWSAATPRATKRSVATPRTSQRTAATAKGKEKVV
ncbi:hypothetical protein Tco_1003654 [Tanacetum coccineum]|uniref:CCHC-type domain-containing protein n=1 Tax=Tanacetum coccineum TaxID=301880 RepID=A0ABQ5F9Q0_9ASTR